MHDLASKALKKLGKDSSEKHKEKTVRQMAKSAYDNIYGESQNSLAKIVKDAVDGDDGASVSKLARKALQKNDGNLQSVASITERSLSTETPDQEDSVAKMARNVMHEMDDAKYYKNKQGTPLTDEDRKYLDKVDE